MPLQPGDRRISTTYNPDNSYLTPDVHLLKQSDPIAAHELARILDTLGRHAYRGVVWVGQVNPADYFLDESANPIAGFIGAPLNTLNDGYVAALSRFGDSLQRQSGRSDRDWGQYGRDRTGCNSVPATSIS